MFHISKHLGRVSSSPRPTGYTWPPGQTGHHSNEKAFSVTPSSKPHICLGDALAEQGFDMCLFPASPEKPAAGPQSTIFTF